MNKEQLVIQQIHNAFDGAQDLLLEEAEVTLEANMVDDTDHIKQLVELGFTNSKQVTEASAKMATATENKKMAEKVLYYKRTYPFLKFLTVEKLDEICEKYNLIHAPVANFIEDVPEKNLKEIAAAQALLGDDRKEETWRIINHDSVDFFDGITKKQQKKILNATYDERPKDRVIVGKFADINTRMIFRSSLPCEKDDQSGLFIAAPKNHFDLKGLTQKGTKGFFKTILETTPPDPIVFRYVKGGIQVLSKWGLEASDPALTNEIDN